MSKIIHSQSLRRMNRIRTAKLNGKSEKEKTHTQMRLRVRSEFTITFIQCSFGIEWHFYT